MATAFVQEWKDAAPGTTNYDAISAKLDVQTNPPEGLIAHTAGRDSNGVFGIFDIWESPEQAKRFQDERLMPSVREAVQHPGGDMTPPDKADMYDLQDFLNPEAS